MKKLLLVSMFLLSFGAFAQNEVAESICYGMTFDSDKMECLQVVRRGYIADNSAEMCRDNITFKNSNLLPCLEAAINKEYTSQSLSICASMSFDSNKIDCLKTSGYEVRTRRDREVSAEMKLQRIERLARAVKRDLMNGRVGDALSKVIRIIDIAEDERY